MRKKNSAASCINYQSHPEAEQAHGACWLIFGLVTKYLHQICLCHALASSAILIAMTFLLWHYSYLISPPMIRFATRYRVLWNYRDIWIPIQLSSQHLDSTVSLMLVISIIKAQVTPPPGMSFSKPWWGTHLSWHCTLQLTPWLWDEKRTLTETYS